MPRDGRQWTILDFQTQTRWVAIQTVNHNDGTKVCLFLTSLPAAYKSRLSFP